MKNKILILCLLVIGQIGYSQTIEETSNWIENNAGAPNNLFSNTIAYNSQTNRLLLYKNYSAPFKFRKVTEIDPKDVSSISLYKATKKGDLGGILLNFKKGGSYTKIYLANNNTRVSKVNKVEEKKMFAFPILAEGGLEHTKRIKWYYLNLFQHLGIAVKDGDTL
ncbi:MAG: hypothetical protein APF83_07920 [Lutibacter sp. BRH_c52]|nr:MAG: hypothetical protein APF83_07920 [Lutibacter sp. BRH_c52]